MKHGKNTKRTAAEKRLFFLFKKQHTPLKNSENKSLAIQAHQKKMLLLIQGSTFTKTSEGYYF